MDNESKELLESAGFNLEHFTDTSMYFTKELEIQDKQYAIEHLLPNHFTPNKWRSVFVAQMYPNNAGEFWYVTSVVGGTYRGYRCRNRSTDFTTANIFASGKTCLSAVTAWLRNYKDSRYNVQSK